MFVSALILFMGLINMFEYGDAGTVKRIFRKLRWEVARVWLRVHPRVELVGITGSVGKTTGKEMMRVVLGEQFEVKSSKDNLDQIFNIPLTILGLRGKEKVVLEMGVSKAGEMDAYLDLVKPRIGVVTEFSLAHVDEEHFDGLQGLIEEKSKLVESLPFYGWAVLNGDNEKVGQLEEKTKAWVLKYGFGEENDVRIEGFEHVQSERGAGSRFEINYGLGKVEIESQLLGRHNAKLAGMVLAVGMIEGMGIERIKKGLEAFEPFKQRLETKWAGERLIIDDTYNASPEAVKAGIDVLVDLDRHGVLVLGDMLELGDHSREEHFQVGEYAYRLGVKKLVVMGVEARFAIEGFLKAGGEKDDVLVGQRVGQIVEWLEGGMETVLVKGSRGMRMERVVNGITS